MKEYDLFVPLTYNDGTPIEPEKLEALRTRLHEFDGLTFFPEPNQGFWRTDERTYHDEIVIYRVLSPDAAGSRAFLQRLKADLLRDLRQEAILIVERDVRTV